VKAWAANTIQTLLQMSPTSLKVVFRQLSEGISKDAEECFKMEYRMSQRFVVSVICFSRSARFIHFDSPRPLFLLSCLLACWQRGVDFYEGIRAVLIDKDKKPNWNPKTLAEVTDKDVDEYFQKAPDREWSAPTANF
jgi:hypothetical protein